jgi:hypothetical protein
MNRRNVRQGANNNNTREGEMSIGCGTNNNNAR